MNFSQRKEQPKTNKKLDQGVQCNTLKPNIQELKSEIDNFIAEKDEDDYVHMKKILHFKKKL